MVNQAMRPMSTASSDHPSPVSVPRTRLEGDTAKLRGLFTLGGKGWSALLLDVQRLLQDCTEHVSVPTLPPSELRTSPSQQLLFAAFRQLVTIKERDDKITLQKHLYNLEAAAFFVNWMLQGNMDFPEHTKDLLARLEEAADRECIPLDRVRTSNGRRQRPLPDVTKLRQPLFLAMAVSPLILLSDISTMSTNLTRIQMIRAWFHYGNERPPLLRLVEGMLWRELFSMAHGHKTSMEGLVSFMRNALPYIPLASSERYFFAPGESRGGGCYAHRHILQNDGQSSQGGSVGSWGTALR
ncbi:hypothetical protein MPER_09840 [Moniliophthora perniciosa FA553]|nr:hypothetical protein MPER_09840 [Moniliophthora perniciosa FA553]